MGHGLGFCCCDEDVPPSSCSVSSFSQSQSLTSMSFQPAPPVYQCGCWCTIAKLWDGPNGDNCEDCISTTILLPEVIYMNVTSRVAPTSGGVCESFFNALLGSHDLIQKPPGGNNLPWYSSPKPTGAVDAGFNPDRDCYTQWLFTCNASGFATCPISLYHFPLTTTPSWEREILGPIVSGCSACGGSFRADWLDLGGTETITSCDPFYMSTWCGGGTGTTLWEVDIEVYG